VRSYPFAKNLALEGRPSSIGLLLNREPIAVFGNTGATTAYAHSGVYVKGSLYVAVGNRVVCVSPCPFQYKWSVQADAATCFGIYFEELHQALISHGELEIARISEGGQLIWSTKGADIFTGELSLHPQFIEVVDFNGKTYRFNYENGLP
jgi:hypothetical protein